MYAYVGRLDVHAPLAAYVDLSVPLSVYRINTTHSLMCC